MRLTGVLLATTVAVLLLVAPLAAEAQPIGKASRIGYLSPGSAADQSNPASGVSALRQGLRELGYVEGQNLVIESRYAEGDADRLPSLATELVRLKVAIIVTWGPGIPAAMGNQVDWDALTAGLKFKSRTNAVTNSYADYLQREAASNAAIREARKKNPVQAAFLTMFIPASAAENFLTRILATPKETFGTFRLSPVMFDARKFARPMFKLPGEDVALVLWMFRAVPMGDAAGYATLMETNRAILERMRAVGGKAYPPQAPYFSKAAWEAHYGPETWRRLLAAKKTADPNGILTPGPLRPESNSTSITSCPGQRAVSLRWRTFRRFA